MIIILKSGVTDDQIDHVIERVESFGLKAHLSRGTHRTIVGVIGDKSELQPERFRAISGVADVIAVLPSYKLASVEAQPEPSVVEVGGVKIGGGHLAMIAGPVRDRKRRADGHHRPLGAMQRAPTFCAAERSNRAPVPTPTKAWAKRG